MNESRCYIDSPVLAEHQLFNRNGKALSFDFRGSKKSVLLYTTDCGDGKEDLGLKLQQRSVSLTALHTGSGTQQQYLEPRMAQLETLEAKMASIEVSLSTTPRRKKGGSISGGVISPAGHRNRDHYKELDALRIALRDKENIIQTLKGQLCNTLSNRLALRNGAPPLTEADRKAAEERLQRLRRDADNKRLAIKNLKLALERLDITDNIDVRIQQAELEYRLGREELELLTLREESRALQAALELAETQEKQKNDTIFSCISGSTQVTIHAVEVSADPKSPRFGAGPREDTPGLYVDWAVEDSGLCKGDRILEVNGKLVVGAGRSDLARLLAVAPDAAQIVVLRKGESLAALRTLRSDNLRLTHRIGYLEEQVRDLLAPSRAEVPADPPPTRQEQVQVFQKGPQVTALVANLPGLNVRNSMELRQSLPTVRSRHSDHSKRSLDVKISNEFDSSSASIFNGHHKSRSKQKHQGFPLTRSTASLDCKQTQIQSQLQRRRPPRVESALEHLSKNRKNSSQVQPLDFDSEPTYYRLQTQSRASENSDISVVYSSQESKSRPAPPKKPLRLSLHRAASLQSVESAPPSAHHEVAKKPMKRSHKGDPPEKGIRTETNGETNNQMQESHSNPPQPPPRTPSRAESCQSALRWPSPKPRPHLAPVTMEKWC
ncbi:PDZ domain-containing protein sprite isoform X2 [Bombus vancouverensis nearcticus]|uniref:PDZ domain-containing protein sprite isoform X2 n=1 Tax=Bombus vancouverensis nearcticus TaxID=2705178 RepID=UPI00402B2A73